MKPWDKKYLHEANEVAKSAREHGNHPFGAILVDQNGNFLLSAENSVISDKDCTAHAETCLIRNACKEFDSDFLSSCTIYASTEPCPMCTGAIFWANVRRIVFGLGEERLYGLIGENTEEVLLFHCKELISKGQKSIEVLGPLLEEEALEVHKGFWV